MLGTEREKAMIYEGLDKLTDRKLWDLFETAVYRLSEISSVDIEDCLLCEKYSKRCEKTCPGELCKTGGINLCAIYSRLKIKLYNFLGKLILIIECEMERRDKERGY